MIPTEAQTIASRYKVLRELGRGGMGVVYLVEHVHTGDHLALKLLLGDAAFDAGAVERFKREARASARIKSENVVKVVDADTAPELGGAPFLVMELLNGNDLQKQLEQRGRFSPADALKYLTEAARALDKSHAIGIVHRDLKPENLYLHTREDGTTLLKILDFGISKVVGGETGNDMTGAGMTNTGTVMGTPLYMSPEQARGRVAEIGPGTDVWAMGLISLQLLTGEVYWQANTVAELMSQILSEPLYPPTGRWPWLPSAMDAWFARSCAREHTLRFAHVGEQIDALGEALGLRKAAAPIPQSSVSALAATASQGDASGNVYAATPAQAAQILGVHTTTGAVARDGAPRKARSRSVVAAGIGIIVLAAAGTGAAWIVRAQMHAAPGSVSAASVANASSLPEITASSPPAPIEVPLARSVDAGVSPSAVPAPPRSAAAVNPKPGTRLPAAHKPPAPNAEAPSSNEVPASGPKKPFAPAGL